MVKISPLPTKSPDEEPSKVIVTEKSRIFPSARFFISILLCCCFIALSVATSNVSLSMVCMVRKLNWTQLEEGDLLHTSTNSSCPFKEEDDVTVIPCSERNKLEWTSTQQGFIFAAQNFGSLSMLVTGHYADKLNSKWAIVGSLVMIIASNVVLPLVAPISVWLAFVCRLLVGVGDALLFPSSSSMISRWFPPKERPFAIGFITGGRQIGNLLILTVGGVLCSSDAAFGGWTSIFYLSAIIASVVLVLWIFLSADKPSKHCCVSSKEEEYITRKVEEESLGKRKERGTPPWRSIFLSRPLWVAVAALVCHEYPLVIMLQLLPKYFSDVLKLTPAMNGLMSSLPIATLWLSKNVSSSIASLLTAHQIMSKTTSCKVFNFVASLGLGICVGVAPLLNNPDNPAPAIAVLCLANFFAGMHTPGVQTALIQLAPAYSGTVTGISFSCVAFFSILNKLLSNFILETGSSKEWTIVFEISALTAVLPTVFFTLWGSAERQPWASRDKSKEEDIRSETLSENTSAYELAKLSMYLSHVNPE